MDLRSRGRRSITVSVVIIVGAAATMVASGTAQASGGCGTIGYAYDAAGRLTGASDQSGHTATYIYDPTGNLLSTQNTGSPAMWIQSVVPVRGAPGTAVTVTGGCFSTVVGENDVQFGGVAAPVISASTHQLIATVPAGAPTGPVTVHVGADAATSSTEFIVDAPVTPLISSLSATVVSPGQSVTASGSGFDPAALNDVLSVGRVDAVVQSATAVSLSFQAPTGGSGQVKLRTPGGSTQAGNDVYVVPWPYLPSQVVDAERIATGVAKPVSLPGTGKIAMLAFDLASDQFASVSLAANTFGSCALNVYAFGPYGGTAASASCIGASGFVDRFGGTAGTWVVLVATAGGAGSVSVTVNAFAADPTASLAAGGSAVTVGNTAPGQNATFTFTGTAGQRVFLRLSSGTLGSDYWATVKVLRPEQLAVLTDTTCGQACDFQPFFLPVDGMYTVLFDPVTTAVGSITARLYNVLVDATGPVTIDGSPTTFGNTGAFQNASLTFTGSAGHRIYFQFSSGTLPNASAYVWVQAPDLTVFLSSKACGTSCYWDTTGLAQTGIYKIFYDPTDMNIGSLTARIYDVPPDTSGSIALDGSPVTFGNTILGQNAKLTFTGTAGHRLYVDFSAGTLPNASAGVWLQKPDLSSQLSTPSCGAACYWDTTGLAQTGTFTIWFDPANTQVGSITARAYDVPADAVFTATVNGPAVTMANTAVGQNAKLTFAGSGGQSVTIGLTAGTLPNASANVWVQKPDLTVYQASKPCGTSCSFGPLTLPATGTYTVWYTPTAAAIGSLTATITGSGAFAPAVRLPLEQAGATPTAPQSPCAVGRRVVADFTAADSARIESLRSAFIIKRQGCRSGRTPTGSSRQ